MVRNVHWRQDVLMGRKLGAATVAVLHTKSEFRSHLEDATAEYGQASKSVAYDCATETQALEIEIPVPTED